MPQLVSLDACMGFSRKKAAGKSVTRPFHDGHFFVDVVEDVDSNDDDDDDVLQQIDDSFQVR